MAVAFLESVPIHLKISSCRYRAVGKVGLSEKMSGNHLLYCSGKQQGVLRIDKNYVIIILNSSFYLAL